jgi:hypothetical protein
MRHRRFRGRDRQAAPLTIGGGLSIRRVTALFVAVVLAFLFVPVGAVANAVPKVFIADPVNNANIAHVDSAGNLQVAGSLQVANTPTVKAQQDGTWNVGISGTPTVDVGNFPSTQDVNVTGGRLATATDIVNAPAPVLMGGDTFDATVPEIMATSVVVAKGNSQGLVQLGTPLSSDVIVAVDDTDGTQPEVTMTFPYPVPIDSVHFACSEDASTCLFFVSIVGFVAK